MAKKILFMVVLSAAIWSCKHYAPLPARAPYEELENVLRYFSREKYSDAQDLLKEILKKPGDPALLGKASFLLALTALRQEDWNKSVEFFQKAIPSYPPLADYSQYYLALALQKRGDMLLSLEALDFLIRQHPLSRWKKQAEIDIAGMYFSMGNYDQALSHYKDVASSYPGDDQIPDILFFIAQCKEMKERWDDAAKGYLSLWLTEPLSSRSNEAKQRFDALISDKKTTIPQPSLDDLWKRAQRLMQGSNYKEGEDETRELLLRAREEKNETLIPAISHALGTYAYYKNSFTNAAASFSEASEAGKGETKEQAMFWLGKALSQVDKTRARETYNELLRMFPKGKLAPNALYKLALIDIGEGNEEQGIYNLMDIVKRFPKSPEAPEAMWDAGWRLYMLGQHLTALSLFQSLKTNRFCPPDLIQQALYWEARTEEQLGEKENARLIYTSFKNLSPGYYGLMSLWRLIEMGTPLTSSAGYSLTGNTLPKHSPSGNLSSDIVYHYQRARDLMELALKDDAKEELAFVLNNGQLDRETLLHLSDLYRDMGEYNISQYIPKTYLQKYLEKQPDDSNIDVWYAAYPRGHATIVEEYIKQYSLPQNILYAMILEESRFKEKAVSRANALGLMQLIPPTGSFAAKRTRMRGFSPELLFEPGINIGLGSWYLKQLFVQFDGNLILSIASYNAGPQRVLAWLKDIDYTDADKFVEEIPFPETRGYVKKVLGSLEAYNTIFGGDLELERAIPFPLKVREKVDLKALGINNK